MSINLKNVANHYWLMNRKQNTFHAYLTVREGEDTVCKSGPHLGDLKYMDVPGNRSVCCIHCFQGLYGLDLTLETKEKS